LEFDLQWLLLGLPLAFALGWLGSRFDLRQFRRDSRDAPKAYFKGLNLLLNEQQDKAIDAFIEAVQNDPETTELHFALGNLFRRRGEFERAVRVHQHLLGRADLKAGERERAQHELAQDFMKAGLFDRAEAAYRALDGSAFAGEARLALLSLYERSRDWRLAAQVAAQLEAAGSGSFAARIAHHWCELAVEADERGQHDEGAAAIEHARQAAPASPRPLVLAGQRLARAGDHAGRLCGKREGLRPRGAGGRGAEDAVRQAAVARPRPGTRPPRRGAAAGAVPERAAHAVGRAAVAVAAAVGLGRRRPGRRARRGRARRQAAAALPLRGLRLRGAALLLAMPGLPELGQLPAAAGGRALNAVQPSSCCSSKAITSRCVGTTPLPPMLATTASGVLPVIAASPAS